MYQSWKFRRSKRLNVTELILFVLQYKKNKYIRYIFEIFRESYIEEQKLYY